MKVVAEALRWRLLCYKVGRAVLRDMLRICRALSEISQALRCFVGKEELRYAGVQVAHLEARTSR